jgi:uncharacterized membrane protein YgdD (TMEM256/DUF423 family)
MSRHLHMWQRVAGVSGAAAIGFATYGAHAFRPKDDHYLEVYRRGNQFHLLHSLLIAIAPVTRQGFLIILHTCDQLLAIFLVEGYDYL